jgi:guanosine-3',5'-bis(diphosphate) 3'-pyrophosphohydrolase
MDIDNIIAKVREYCPQCEPDFLRQAYAYAENAYGSQKTAPGESSLRHTLQAAMILAEFHLDPSAIAAALLQDVLTLGFATSETVQEKFDPDTARLVGGITRLNNITWGSLKLTFVAERPPPPQRACQELLMAAEAGGEYFS